MSGFKKEKLISAISVLFMSAAIFLLFFYAAPAFAETKLKIPKPAGYVNDFAGIISAQNIDNLDFYLDELENKTGAQVAVVTLSSLQGNSVEDVSLEIGRKWGVGQKGKDNGVVILVAPGDRKMRIEVGYGLEGVITDGKAGRIRDDYMIPEFRQGNYEKGIVNGAIAVASEIAAAYKAEMPESFNSSVSKLSEYSGRIKPSGLNFIVLIIFVIFFFISPRSLLWFLLGFSAGGYGNYGSGFGGSSGGNNFGGFGGGSFGGGGASGSW